MKRLILLSFSLLIITACCKDEPKEEKCFDPSNSACENYDPCFGVDSFAADFNIHDVTYFPEKQLFLPPSDKYVGGEIGFKAKWKGPNLKHIFYIGSEIVEDTLVIRNFGKVSRPNQIKVSYVMHGTYERCDGSIWSGRDSTSKTFSLIETNNDLAITGVFKIAREGTQDSFSFRVKSIGITDTASVRVGEDGQLWVINLFNHQDTFFSRRNVFRPLEEVDFIPNGPFMSSDKLGHFRGSFDDEPKGELFVEDGLVRMDYVRFKEQFHFRGRKIR